MHKAITVVVLSIGSFSVNAATDYWNTADRLSRRTCPSLNCGVVGQLFFREKATVFEQKGGWSRISEYYEASCRGGQSDYVDSGNKACSPSNGIKSGQVAEWVATKYLSKIRPADPGAGAQGNEVLVKSSDDYRLHKDAFLKAATDLIASGRCKREEFIEAGGWVKSTNHRNMPIYFMYCGGSHVRNRIYLNASSGKVFK